MSNSYENTLNEQYNWYIKTINDHHINYRHFCIPTDAYYLKLTNGSIKKLDTIEWLEEAILKLQDTLALIERHIEREKFKQLKRIDLISILNKI